MSSIEDNEPAYLKLSCKIFSFFHLLVKNQNETDAKVESLQKAIAAFREQFQDFRAEQQEDSQEIKRRIRQLQFTHRECVT